MVNSGRTDQQRSARLYPRVALLLLRCQPMQRTPSSPDRYTVMQKYHIFSRAAVRLKILIAINRAI